MLYELLYGHVVAKSTWFVEDTTTYQSLPLFRLLFYVFYLPFDWRKWILDACRIQSDMRTNIHLSKFLVTGQLFHSFIHKSQSFSVDKELIAELFSNIYDSSISCAILSFFVRAEGTAFLAEASAIKDMAIQKEISAAFLPDPGHTQVLDYSFIGNRFGNSNVTQNLFNNGLARIRTQFSRHDSILLFPYYNNRKNVGDRTASAYLQITEQESLRGTQVTSLDLLKYYHRTGRTIPGPVEVRCKWGTSDLKPRVYYALGGDAYFSGMYIQKFANMLCDILPSTNPHSRFDVTRLRTLSSGEILVTYDYTSFTTSLSELKYFVHSLSVWFRGVEMDVLDVHSGITTLDVGEYLENYNNQANYHQRFDLGRLFEDVRGVDFYQGRNGSLGTQGNITLSTALHGVNLSSFTQTPYEDSCVGDDALSVIVFTLLPAFINHTINLGHINPDKFTTWEVPPFDDPTLATRQQFKYLKRPLTVDFVGAIRCGVLDAFPNVSEMLGLRDGFHDTSSKSSIERLRDFCMQYGRFLTRQRNETVNLSYSPEEDMAFVIEVVAYVYRLYRIPKEGIIPGMAVWNPDIGGREVAYFFAPPCDDLSVFTEDWASLLYTTYYGEEIIWPVYTSEVVPPADRVCPGMSFRASASHPLVKIMEALGYFVTVAEKQVYRFDEVMFKEVLMNLKGDSEGTHMLCEVTVLSECPDWYVDACIYFLSEKHVGDPFEALTDVDTMFSY